MPLKVLIYTAFYTLSMVTTGEGGLCSCEESNESCGSSFTFHLFSSIIKVQACLGQQYHPAGEKARGGHKGFSGSVKQRNTYIPYKYIFFSHQRDLETKAQHRYKNLSKYLHSQVAGQLVIFLFELLALNKDDCSNCAMKVTKWPFSPKKILFHLKF